LVLKIIFLIEFSFLKDNGYSWVYKKCG